MFLENVRWVTFAQLFCLFVCFENLKRSTKKKFLSRYFMQPVHVCLPSRFFCETAPARFIVIHVCDVPPHISLVAAFFCPVHECFMHRMLHTFLIFEVGLTAMLCAHFEVNFILKQCWFMMSVFLIYEVCPDYFKCQSSTAVGPKVLEHFFYCFYL